MSLSDRELLQRAWNERDPLTTTELETKLAERFEALLEEHEAIEPLLKVLDDKGFEYDTQADVEELDAELQVLVEWPQAKLLLAVLNDFDLDNDEVLRERLVRLRKLDDAMADLAEPLQAMAGLVEPLQALTTLATTE